MSSLVAPGTLVHRPVGGTGAPGSGSSRPRGLSPRRGGAAKASLIRGLSASARHGEPVAVAFTLQDGKLQLSVCTVRRETFWHVTVDPTAWKVVAVEPITSGDALAAAHARRAALTSGKWSLHTIAVNILKAPRVFSLVSIVPSLKAMERPVAEVTLVKGDLWNTVVEMLN